MSVNDTSDKAQPNRLGRVTKVYPHSESGDNSNYEVDVVLVDSGDPTGSDPTGGSTSGDSQSASPDIPRVPVTVSQPGMAHGIEEGTLVSVAFRVGAGSAAYVDGIFYSSNERAPLVKPGDWRTRIDTSVFETITNDDGDRLVRIGRQPDDRGELDMGLVFNFSQGSFEIFDSSGNGLCCDGEGNVTISQLGGLGSTQQSSTEQTDSPSTVNLGDEGLTDGDNLDDYLDEYLEDNTTVEVPPGEYESDGSGFDAPLQDAEVIGKRLRDDAFLDGGSATTNAGPTLITPSGTDRNTVMTVTGGTVAVRNFQIQGARDGGSVFDVAVTDREGEFILEDVHMVDGDTGVGSSAPAVKVRSEHSGSVRVRNCTIEGFREGGLDASEAGGNGLGRTIVEGGLFQDNNIANVLLSGAGSKAEAVTSVQTGASPETTPARGVWLTEYSEAALDGVDIVQDDASGSAAEPVRLGGTRDNPNTSQGDSKGELRYVRIQNETDAVAVDALDGEFGGQNNAVTGNGDLSVNGVDFLPLCQGPLCDAPTTIPETRFDK